MLSTIVIPDNRCKTFKFATDKTHLSTHTREKPCFQSLWSKTIVKDLKVCHKQNTLKHSYQRETILSIIVVHDICQRIKKFDF